MAFVSVEDDGNPLTSPIVGIFACPQLSPIPPGYIGEVSDHDPRISAFIDTIMGKE